MAPRERRRSSTLLVEGEFDLPSARMLEHSLRGLKEGDLVRIDFRRVRQFHDYAIAALAQALTKLGGATVKLEGLGTHHVRLLRYFGIDADVFRRDTERKRRT
jgi:STAS domain